LNYFVLETRYSLSLYTYGGSLPYWIDIDIPRLWWYSEYIRWKNSPLSDIHYSRVD